MPKCGARFGWGGKLVTFQGKCLKVHTQLASQGDRNLTQRVIQFDKEVQQAMSDPSTGIQGYLDRLIH